MNLSAFVKSKSEFVLMIFGILVLSTVNMITLRNYASALTTHINIKKTCYTVSLWNKKLIYFILRYSFNLCSLFFMTLFLSN